MVWKQVNTSYPETEQFIFESENKGYQILAYPRKNGWWMRIALLNSHGGKNKGSIEEANVSDFSSAMSKAKEWMKKYKDE